MMLAYSLRLGVEAFPNCEQAPKKTYSANHQVRPNPLGNATAPEWVVTS